MKCVMGLCVVVVAVTSTLLGQEQTKPTIKHGIHVEMAAASHAVPMPAADEQDATVVGVTADGKVFVGPKPVEINALSNLDKGIIYVKADARAPYQKVLEVLDALNGRSVVLLTRPASQLGEKGKIVPPYGMKVTIGGQ